MPWRWPWRRVCASWRDTGPMYQAERSAESNLADDMVLGPGMGGVCCSRLLAKLLPAVGFGAEEGPLGRAIRGLGQDLTLGSGPRSILRHRPPAPGRLTERAGPGTLGKAPGSRWAKRSSSGGRLGLLGCPASRGGSGDFCPGTRRLRSLRSPQRPSPSPKQSTPTRVAPPGPFHPARSQ